MQLLNISRQLRPFKSANGRLEKSVAGAGQSLNRRDTVNSAKTLNAGLSTAAAMSKPGMALILRASSCPKSRFRAEDLALLNFPARHFNGEVSRICAEDERGLFSGDPSVEIEPPFAPPGNYNRSPRIHLGVQESRKTGF